MKKFTAIFAAFAVLFLACGNVFAGGHGGHGGYGGHGGRPAPHYVHHDGGHHHHHHDGPSDGWWNGALIVGATLGVLDIATRAATAATTTEVVTVPAQPATVVVQQPAQPQVVYVQQPATTTTTTVTPAYTTNGQVIYTQPATQTVVPASVIYR